MIRTTIATILWCLTEIGHSLVETAKNATTDALDIVFAIAFVLVAISPGVGVPWTIATLGFGLLFWVRVDMIAQYELADVGYQAPLD